MSTGAPERNQNALKWKTPEERVAACGRLCDHLRSGLGFDCWEEASFPTIQSYIEDYPIEFKSDLIDDADRARKAFFQRAGVNGMLGQIDGFSSPTWKFQMQNICNWRDKTESEVNGNMTLSIADQIRNEQNGDTETE